MVKYLVEYSKNGPLLFLYFVLTGIFFMNLWSSSFFCTNTQTYARDSKSVFDIFYVHFMERQTKQAIDLCLIEIRFWASIILVSGVWVKKPKIHMESLLTQTKSIRIFWYFLPNFGALHEIYIDFKWLFIEFPSNFKSIWWKLWVVFFSCSRYKWNKSQQFTHTHKTQW